MTALWILAVLAAASVAAGCGGRSAVPPSNDLLIVGYDREPDTLNRFSTHILEDIQSCIVEGLTTTDEQMRVRPREDLNSLAWLMWHIARAEDIMVNQVLAGRGPVLDDGWKRRLGIGRPDFGIGMTSAEVSDLTQQIDLGALRAYRDAVGLRTRDVVSGFTLEDWDGTVAADRVEQAAGTLEGAGTWRITTAMTWTGGTQAGAGQTIVLPAATMTRSSTNTVTLNERTLRVEGSVLVTGTGNMQLQNGGTIQTISSTIGTSERGTPNESRNTAIVAIPSTDAVARATSTAHATLSSAAASISTK